ncbi:diacylglycerol kinase [soil metagenome]
MTKPATELPTDTASVSHDLKSSGALGFGRVWRALGYSRKGIASAWRDEAAFRQELALFVVLAPLTLWLRLPTLDTVVLLALMGLVLTIELLNSGLEALVDKTTPELHRLAGKAKDCGSAAVLMSMLTFGGAWLSLAGPALFGAIRSAMN